MLGGRDRPWWLILISIVATDLAAGVHSHGGGFSSGGNNSGTSLFHPDFETATGQAPPPDLRPEA